MRHRSPGPEATHARSGPVRRWRAARTEVGTPASRSRFTAAITSSTSFSACPEAHGCAARQMRKTSSTVAGPVVAVAAAQRRRDTRSSRQPLRRPGSPRRRAADPFDFGVGEAQADKKSGYLTRTGTRTEAEQEEHGHAQQRPLGPFQRIHGRESILRDVVLELRQDTIQRPGTPVERQRPRGDRSGQHLHQLLANPLLRQQREPGHGLHHAIPRIPLRSPGRASRRIAAPSEPADSPPENARWHSPPYAGSHCTGRPGPRAGPGVPRDPDARPLRSP